MTGNNFTYDDSFIGHYVNLVADTVVPYQEKIIKDEIPGIEKSHALMNFKMTAEKIKTGSVEGEFYGMVFQDSDVAKWLEAASYCLMLKRDAALEKRCDEIIDIIGNAQHDDGYLNTYFTVKEPDRRWTNLYEAHELYCAGHMMEAATAYYRSTQKDKLLKIMCRMADNIYEHFVINKAPGTSGHPEIELALMKLYETTGNEKYAVLAKHFIDVRGVDDYFVKEYETRGWNVWGNDGKDREYAQDYAPVRQQTKAVGHAVRAVYLYSGMADVAEHFHDEELYNACETLFKSIISKRMYITGAIGSAYEGEAFTKDYHLPNDTAYAETCAAVGLIFFSRRMLKLKKASVYADVMEKALYNCVLAGMQQDGKKFFYVNPLEVLPGISGEAKSHFHALPKRPEWFACACCPPNVARLLTSVADYAWDVEAEMVYSHLYIGGRLETPKGNITLKTDFPVSGVVTYTFEPNDTYMDITLAVRLPEWSKENCVFVNDEEYMGLAKDGYVFIKGSFTRDDVVSVSFDMSVRKVYANTNVAADTGKMCIMRGPLVYCAEGADNDNDVLSIVLEEDSEFCVCGQPDFYGSYRLKALCTKRKVSDSLYTYDKPEKIPCEITMIPYYAWGNREINQMRVWIPYR